MRISVSEWTLLKLALKLPRAMLDPELAGRGSKHVSRGRLRGGGGDFSRAVVIMKRRPIGGDD